MSDTVSQTQPGRPQIAVVGVSALFPGSLDATGFWRDILAGRDLITDVPPSHWLVEDYYDPDPSAPDKVYVTRGAFLDPIDFDPLTWGIPPSIVSATDTSQLLALIVAEKVLEDATRGQFSDELRERTSVILGVTSAQELLASMVSRLQRPVWVKALREAGLPEAEVNAICDRISGSYVDWQEATFPGVLGNVVAGRIANRLDLGGTNCITDAACASSFSALQMGVNELILGQSDLVITGGVDTMNDIFMYMCFSKTPAMAPSGDCRPFSDQADGTMLGEGLGMVALKRLEDAEANGDRVYAVLRGVGSSSDGRALSVYAPLPRGQARSLRRAYEGAGYGPDTVELVEAHGTGTKAGDVAEFEALRTVFDESGRHDRQWCSLGTVKAQIGHTKATAGAAGLFKVLMGLHHGILPPTIKVDTPNPKLELESSPFNLTTRSRPWVRGSDHPRRASVSSFGFGGSNFHLTLEEYSGPGVRAPRLRTTGRELVILTAENASALAAQVEQHRAAAGNDGYLQWLSYTTHGAYAADAPRRLAIVATDETDLARKLDKVAAHLATSPDQGLSTPDGVHYGVGDAGDGLAYLFPGQGGQYLDMGADLAMTFQPALSAWDRAADLDLFSDQPLHRVVFPISTFDDEHRQRDSARLRATQWAQPAIGGVSLSMLALLEQMGLEAQCVGGHSFGEITALHAAGVLSEEALLRVARRRGELMAAASDTKPGAMTAVARPIEDVRELISGLGAEVVVANHNSPEQVVLSGEIEAIEAVEARLAADEVPPRRLPVSTAFHSSIVSDSTAPFLEFLGGVDFASPRCPVYSNSEAAPYPDDPQAMRRLLADQISKTVRFVDQIEAMYSSGVRTFVEVGPGSVLTNLVRQILAGRSFAAINLDRKGRNGVESLFDAIAQLVRAGFAMDLELLWSGFRVPDDPRQREQSKHAIPISGANYGKPYPPEAGASALPPPNPPRQEVERVSAPAPAPEVAPTPTAPPASVPQTHVATPDSGEYRGWVAAYQEAQRQTAEAHAAYQRAMADAHAAFLRSAEVGMMGLTTMATGGGAAQLPSLPAPPPAPPQATASPPAAAAPPAAGDGLTVSPPAAPAPSPAPQPPPTTASPAGEPAPLPAPAATTGPDVGEVLLEVVADATGYPAEMLMLEMDLESDLGVDSIKRVEILSMMRERVPELPAVDAGDMADLKTLHDIVDSLAAGMPSQTAASASPAASPAPEAPTTAPPAVAGPDLGVVLLEVVAEATGYPAEMLMLEMDLESDLGVDSIKRVEILSMMRERVPELPAVDAGDMADLKTLHDIVDALGAAPLADDQQTDEPVHLKAAGDELGRYVLECVDAPPLGMAIPGLVGGGRIAIVDGGAGVATRLAVILRERGVAAESVDEVPEDATGVVCTCGLRDVHDDDEAIAVNREAFRLVREAGRVLGGNGVLALVYDTGGDCGISGSDPERAWLGGLAGLAKSAAQEWTDASVKAIDLERGGRGADDLAAAVADELTLGGPEVEIGLSADGRRVRPRSVKADAGAETLAVSSRSVIVVSGGARGVTAATLLELARQAQPRLVLLGRTLLAEDPPACQGATTDAELKRALLDAARQRGEAPTPAELEQRVRRVAGVREIRATIDGLSAAGSDVRYEAVDIRDRAAVADVLEKVRVEWGPVTGVIHGAGVIADRLIVDKTDDQFDLVFDTKVEGLRALLSATEGDPLEQLCLFSSVAGRCGNVGQSDYAMANEILNKVADAERRRRGPACLVRSLGWGPWEGGMVTPELKTVFEARGVTLIPLDAGARMLVTELSAGASDQVEIVLGAPPRAEPMLAEEPRAMELEIQVARGSHPHLADHAVDGTPVLPMVLVLEWFARAAQARFPDHELVSIADLKVRRGIRLEAFDDHGDRFTLRCQQRTGGASPTLDLELRGVGGELHYTASAELAVERPAADTAVPDPKLEPWAGGPVYGGVLFHGPDFQVIESVEGFSEQGVVASVAGLGQVQWPVESWRTDGAVLDGGLQLALLWSERVLGGATLPTAIGAIRTWVDGPVDRVRCVLVGRETGPERAVSDLVLTAGDGRRCADLVGVETHLLPRTQS